MLHQRSASTLSIITLIAQSHSVTTITLKCYNIKTWQRVPKTQELSYVGAECCRTLETVQISAKYQIWERLESLIKFSKMFPDTFFYDMIIMIMLVMLIMIIMFQLRNPYFVMIFMKRFVQQLFFIKVTFTENMIMRHKMWVQSSVTAIYISFFWGALNDV